jgi:hypothetical protein
MGRSGKHAKMDDYFGFETKKAPRGYKDPFEAFRMGTFRKLLLMATPKRARVQGSKAINWERLI